MIQLKYSFLFLMVALSFSDCDKGDQAQFTLSLPDQFEDIEYKVYAQVLMEPIVTSSKKATRLIVEQKTSSSIFDSLDSGTINSFKKTHPDFDVTLPFAYTLANHGEYNLDNKIVLDSAKVELISKQQIESIFSTQDIDKNWENFYRFFPSSNGVFKLSKIGFNSNKSQAVVAVSFYYASLGASGSLLFLTKDDSNGWRVVDTITVWIS